MDYTKLQQTFNYHNYISVTPTRLNINISNALAMRDTSM